MIRLRQIALLLVLSIASAQGAPPPLPASPTTEKHPNSVMKDRLSQLQSSMDAERAAILRSSNSLEECDRRYQAWLTTPRPVEETDYIIEQTRIACAATPPDWSRLNRCWDLLVKGVQRPEVVALIKGLVTPHEGDICRSPDTKYLFKAIETLGYQDTRDARKLLTHWAKAATWKSPSAEIPGCDTRYLRLHLRRAALYGIGKQPPKQALPLLRKLQVEVEAGGDHSTYAERGIDLRNVVRMLIRDVKRRQDGDPRRVPSLRGYMYYGPGANIVD